MKHQCPECLTNLTLYLMFHTKDMFSISYLGLHYPALLGQNIYRKTEAEKTQKKKYLKHSGGSSLSHESQSTFSDKLFMKMLFSNLTQV